jgi:predicted cupin superfamily sugar epimerase
LKALKNANYWIEVLRLEPHPEGGYFRQTYKSELAVVPALDIAHPGAQNATRMGQPSFSDARAASTAIHFLIEGENFSAFHRLRSDEIWHFYAGDSLTVHVIDPEGEYSSILLGSDAECGETFQAVVKAGCWFASEISRNPHFWQNRPELGHPKPWALVGCTVAPGFEFEDFDLAKREELVERYPQHRGVVERLTRE